MELYDITAKDFGPYKEFTLPLYKQGLVWVGGVNRDTAAADSNGSGKTSIFRALTWCLYGETIDGEKGDKIIHNGAKKALVETRLVDGKGEYWTIRRSRIKGSPSIELVKPDGEPYKGSKEDVQAKVIEMIGLDFRAFKNTVLYGQNDSARFAHPRTKDAERKDMLHRIMRTEILAKCHEYIKDVARKMRNEVKAIEDDMATFQTRIDEHDIEAMQADHDEWEDDRQGVIAQHKLQAKEFKEAAQAAIAQADDEPELPDVEALKAELKVVEDSAARAGKAWKEAEKLSNDVDTLEEGAAESGKRAAEFSTTLKIANKQLDELDGDTCPVCTTPLNEGAAHDHIEALKANRDKIKEALDKANKEVAVQEAAVAKVSKVYQAKRKEGAKQAALLREVGDLKEQIAEAEAEIAAAEHRVDELREKAKQYIELARKEMAAAKREATKANPYEAQLVEAKGKVAQYKERIRELTREAKEKNNHLAHYEFWSKGFSNQGLPSFVLDSVMPYITERSNHYLETLADGDITMNFSTQRELKSTKGEFRDEIDIQWEVEGLEDSYPPSGGQLKKMEIATDLGLMDLVATREGGHLDILMLDEVLDGLDGEGCSRVLLLLQNLRAHRGSIFVISHEAQVAEVFEKAIFAVKHGGHTVLEAT